MCVRSHSSLPESLSEASLPLRSTSLARSRDQENKQGERRDRKIHANAESGCCAPACAKELCVGGGPGGLCGERRRPRAGETSQRTPLPTQAICVTVAHTEACSELIVIVAHLRRTAPFLLRFGMYERIKMRCLRPKRVFQIHERGIVDPQQSHSFAFCAAAPTTTRALAPLPLPCFPILGLLSCLVASACGHEYEHLVRALYTRWVLRSGNSGMPAREEVRKQWNAHARALVMHVVHTQRYLTRGLLVGWVSGAEAGERSSKQRLGEETREAARRCAPHS